MHPYRSAPLTVLDRTNDDRTLGVVLLLVGGVRLVGAYDGFGPAATIALLVVGLALRLIVYA